MEDAQPQASIVTTDGSSSLYRTSTWLVQHEKRSDERNAPERKGTDLVPQREVHPHVDPSVRHDPKQRGPEPAVKPAQPLPRPDRGEAVRDACGQKRSETLRNARDPE